ncbi:MAG: hypothetical protein NVS1B11_18690 [Terriglobales bacterium]
MGRGHKLQPQRFLIRIHHTHCGNADDNRWGNAIAGNLSGEGSILNVSSITLRSATALAYLIVFGSVIAFTAFSWLVTVSSPSHLSTFAYVNPVVAIFLGWGLAAEQIGAVR